MVRHGREGILMKWNKVEAGIYRLANPGPNGRLWRISRFANDYWELTDGDGKLHPCLSFRHAKNKAAVLMGGADEQN